MPTQPRRLAPGSLGLTPRPPWAPWAHWAYGPATAPSRDLLRLLVLWLTEAIDAVGTGRQCLCNCGVTLLCCVTEEFAIAASGLAHCHLWTLAMVLLPGRSCDHFKYSAMAFRVRRKGAEAIPSPTGLGMRCW